MKLLISSDIEGTCGIADWNETDLDKGNSWYTYFQEQMTKEVAAACEGAFNAGFTEVLVKDAHDTARNIIPAKLPKGVRLIRGWTGDQWSMVDGLQNNVDALAFTGYHAGAYADGSPLAHSFSPSIDIILINGEPASEFTANSYAAGMAGVPVVFISGDSAVCAQAKEMIPQITAVPVLWGRGESTASGHPDLATEAIRSGMEEALSGNWRSCIVPAPGSYDVVVRYATHTKATFAAVYPGAERQDAKSVHYFSENYMDVLRFFHFCV
ncbi:MAG: M55 family metallopeptidase [Peptococcaceae bacterium]|jgi:D-amino peptidase|nr:M55 family metallopeptidase [Peptococcaceae bacterium]